jgi:transcriptional regulator with XRE-family HTH domain
MAKKAEIEACHVAFGAKVRQIREFLGITQDDLAKRVGLARASIANIETGRQRASLEDVEIFAAALGTTPKAFTKFIWG